MLLNNKTPMRKRRMNKMIQARIQSVTKSQICQRVLDSCNRESQRPAPVSAQKLLESITRKVFTQSKLSRNLKPPNKSKFSLDSQNYYEFRIMARLNNSFMFSALNKEE